MDTEQNADVIVVGGGVIGLTTAIVLAERGRKVRVWTREPVERTTSAVAGALWWPYRIEPEALVGAWALESLLVYEELAERPEETGVRLVEGVHGEASLEELGSWAAGVGGLRASTRAEYSGSGLWARLPLIDMSVHLPWLRERLLRAGGRVEERTVVDLAEPGAEAPVVVNCTGLGARELVPDPLVHPVRGQLVVVENPGVTTWLTSVAHSSEESTYFFPQPGGLILGGTAQEDDWSLTPDPRTAEAIVARCAALRPEIAGARVLEHRVGLRPARPSVRLEREAPTGGGTVVHHYGHGGAGVTVAWGCAREAAELAQPDL
ncbi:FAD-dependent oxidoreductase [Streptomyces nodosus]|uniref:D-amino-acid oxidase n=1 Tax=Streptomyces nodosus TaxID=40318 RepID=A0A0B5DSG6_9ACTN|nr:FAD-dependent oxidoreductase [Streptomyces nodosus]AJE43536.1 amino acid oxidase [Streptomyces nodosus]MBB4795010.1 D-amino-acid oxidase [Streptomyces nodosus]QEV42040.1 FAD-binding oxidoreductase [Streptomyces nodosus]